jgi:hypothetical protein
MMHALNSKDFIHYLRNDMTLDHCSLTYYDSFLGQPQFLLDEFNCNSMKIKHLFFLLLICSSCIRPKQPADTGAALPGTFTEGSHVYYPIKDNRIPVDLDNPKKASLFDYFKQIELTPLETNNDVLIGGRLDKIIAHQNCYYILDAQQNVFFVFDAAGQFVSKIDKRGNGPGEYSHIYNMIINSFTGNIDIFELSGRIHSYDLSGNHVNTIRVADQTAGIELIAILNLAALSKKMYVILSKNRPFQINYFDTEANKIVHQEYEESRFAEILGGPYAFYEYHGKWYFSRPLFPETYELSPDSLVKAYTWDFGKYNYDANKIGLSNAMSGGGSDLREVAMQLPYIIHYEGQNNRHVMALIWRDNDKYAYLMYDKSTQECKFIERFDESAAFRPYVVTNEYVLSYCNHGNLENYISKEMLDEVNLQKFEDLIEAEEEMNPILIKYYFK